MDLAEQRGLMEGKGRVSQHEPRLEVKGKSGIFEELSGREETLTTHQGRDSCKPVVFLSESP